MLANLRRIVQEVDNANDLVDALNIIVSRIRHTMKVDVCSIYLASSDQSSLILMATQGLDEHAVMRVRLGMSEGLVGLVAHRSELLNLEDASTHSHFKYFPETGEERFHAFLGVPIVRQGQILGVLVVQQTALRRFGEEDVAFLVTLAAQLAGSISHAEIVGGLARVQQSQADDDFFISGISGASGVAIGTAVVAYSQADLDSVPDRKAILIDEEIGLFREAVQNLQNEMLHLKEQMEAYLPSEERMIFDAYVLMLSSETLIDKTIDRIRNGNWAPGALRETIRENVRVFEAMEDPYLRERAADIHDIGRRLLSHLQAEKRQKEDYPLDTVLVGEDLSATQLAEVPRERLAGVVSASGSGSSHVAILARAMGIPTVMGVSDLSVSRLDGTLVVVDGYQGRICIAPHGDVLDEFRRLAEEERELSEDLRRTAQSPALTPDGVHMPVYVNSGLLSDITPSLQSGADGVGLYRTEVPFMVRDRFPLESEQYAIYRRVLESFAESPVTLRTLDVGGDKALPYFPIQEENPFLGWRGIRITLDHPEIFLPQLRAMLRASIGLNNLSVLFPMIATVRELDESLQLLHQAREELLAEGLDVPMPKTGAMIEVPSAVYLADALASRVDFLSVGTNDLIQYLLAVDRNNSRVANRYHALHPAVLRAIWQVLQNAHRYNKPVSVCGEMAGDPVGLLLLLGMGIDSISVSLSVLPRAKRVIRKVEQREAQHIFEQALAMDDPVEIRVLARKFLIDKGLGGLVRAGKL